MAQDLKPSASAVPDYLRGVGKTTRIGNIDASDLVIPRIKLIQAVSPEIQECEGSKAGEFWHTIAQESLGKTLVAIPILLRKTYILWAPRGDDRGVLARARDAINWDPPEGRFQVKFKNNPNTYTWELAPTVRESGLAEFGTSRPGDANSPPAASLTYETIWYLPDRPDLSPAIIINTRGSIKIFQRFLSMVDAKAVDHYYQKYQIDAVVDKGPTNETFYNYTYRGAGYAEQELGEEMKRLYEKLEHLNIRASDERDDEAAPPSNGRTHASGATERTANTKY